jgi:hypothetical protein
MFIKWSDDKTKKKNTTGTHITGDIEIVILNSS